MQRIIHNHCGKTVFTYHGDVYESMQAALAQYPDGTIPVPASPVDWTRCGCGVVGTGWYDYTPLDDSTGKPAVNPRIRIYGGPTLWERFRAWFAKWN